MPTTKRATWTTLATTDDGDDNATNNAAMPPKRKHPAAPPKPSTKKTMGEWEANKMPPPAAKPAAISNFSVKATDPFMVAYYSNGAHDYAAEVSISVKGTMPREEFNV